MNVAEEAKAEDILPYQKLLTTVGPVQSLVAAATVHIVFMFSAAANFIVEELAKIANSIAKVTKTIATTCKQCS